MKKPFIYILLFLTLLSCEKGSLQQTTDSLKRADSLITTANRGMKTLDSITKTLNDSNGIAKKVIIPEIKKQRKSLDSVIRSGGYRVDSLHRDMEEITKNVKLGTGVAKVLDSANQAINKGENPLKVLTRAADRILDQTRTKTETRPAEKSSSTDETKPVAPSDYVRKKAFTEIEVQNLSAAKTRLKQYVQQNDGEIWSESAATEEGRQQETFRVRVPLQNFELLMSAVSDDLGSLRSKIANTEGNVYDGARLSDLEVTLVQNEPLAAAQAPVTDTEKPDSFSEKSSGAFGQGVELMKKAFLALMPFWPVLLLAMLILFFVWRSRRKRKISETTPVQNVTVEEVETPSTARPEQEAETDYSKYLPKQ